MRNAIIQSTFALIVALATQFALADSVAPDALIKAVTVEVIALIRADKDIQAGNPVKVANLVETKILPLFDFGHMTQLAVAHNWRLASPDQQKQLTAEFKTLLVRTYSTALSSYRDQPIDFKPLRLAAGATEATVKSVVKQPGTDALTMDYVMEMTAAGWKVYDVKVDGVSLITTYRGSFDTRIHDAGIEGLIKLLTEKNRARDSHARNIPAGRDYMPIVVQGILQGGV